MYYNLNVEKLKELRDSLYKHLIDFNTSESETDIEVTSIKTKTDDLALELKHKNIIYRMNSKYNPKQEAKNWADQFNIKNLDTILISFGFGNGIFIRELLNKMNDNNRIIIYEPSVKVFLHVLEYYNIVDIIEDNRVFFVFQEVNDSDLPYLLSCSLTWMNLFSQLVCIHPEYDKIFLDSFDIFQQMIRDNTFDNLIAKNTTARIGKHIIDNTIDNIKYLNNSISVWNMFENFSRDIPVFIVAAGPSLNKNIEVLKKAKGKSIIFCVDRAYEILLKHNIEPDFVVILDPLKPLEYCGNQKGFTAPLLMKLEASQEILKYHSGRKIIYNCEEYTNSIYKHLGKEFENISPGGSVATAAFAICVKLSFNRIILVGQDLAYDGDISHAGSELVIKDNDSINIYVEDIFGNQVQTRYDWYSFLRWFEKVILQIPECDIIDATEGGAKIKGTRIMTLQEVIDNYCILDINCEKIVEEISSDINKNDIKDIYDYLIVGRNELDKIKKLSKENIGKFDLLKYYIKKENNKEQKKLLHSIEKNSKKIEKSTIFGLVNKYVLSFESDDIEKLYFMTNKKETDENVAFESSKKIYVRTLEACEYIKPKLENAMEYYKDLIIE